MSFQQKSSIVALVTLVITFAVYTLLGYLRYNSLGLDISSNTKFLAGAFLILIPALFMTQLFSFVVFSAIEKTVHKEKLRFEDDEMDKQIDKKITILSMYVMVLGFFASIALLLFDLSVGAMLIGMGVSVLIGGISGFVAKFYYCTRGV